MEQWGAVALLALIIGLYILPVLIASFRGHPETGAITVLTLLFGWTLLAWGVALIWSLTAIPPRVRVRSEPPPDEPPPDG
jgi:hypothetical protein